MRENRRPSMPPASLTRFKAVSTPSFIWRPSSLDGPVKAVLIPSVSGATTAAGRLGGGAGAVLGRRAKNAMAAAIRTVAPIAIQKIGLGLEVRGAADKTGVGLDGAECSGAAAPVARGTPD